MGRDFLRKTMTYPGGLSAALLWGFLVFSGSALAQSASSHPFGAAPPRAAPAVTAPEPARDGIVAFLRQQQKSMQKSLVDSLRRARTEGSLPAFFGLVVAGFIYGVLHAAGPGHGKAIISSYIFAAGGGLWPAIRLSFLSALAQAVTAIVLIGALVLVLNFTASHVRAATAWLESAGAILITFIGAWMTWGAIAAFRRRRGGVAPGCGHAAHAPDPEHGHEHGEACGHAAVHGAVRGVMNTGRIDRSVILAIGLRPCSGALLVLVFGQAIGMFAAGMAATVAMAVGTGLTVAVLALLTVTSRRLAERTALRPTWTEPVHLGLGLAGSMAVTALGLLLLLASVDSEGAGF
jgi:ABC-type nickel/cobalt efflux system permease component RcnA